MSQPFIAVSRRTRPTPFSERVKALGVKAYTVYNHMLLATAFRSLEEDYHHLKRHVQLWDVSVERQVALSGPDAFRLAQMMTPRDLGRAAVGQCLYAPLVDEAGGMINDPVLLKLAEDRLWLSIADSDVLLWAKGLALGFGLEVTVEEPEVYPLAVQGPKADDLMAQVFGDAVRAIRFFRFERLAFRGHPLVVARSGWSKQGGFEIYLDAPALALELWDALWDAGQAFEVGPGCPNTIERIEGGLFSYGNDMTRENNPFECGLDRYCHLDRPIEFIARPALEKIKAEGPRRLLRGVRFDGGPVGPYRGPWRVLADGSAIGAISSAATSPDLGCNIAFAMLDRGHWTAGTPVEVETPEGRCRGEVSDIPFI
jgi:dimethylsulfoniopropionate demethylase